MPITSKYRALFRRIIGLWPSTRSDAAAIRTEAIQSTNQILRCTVETSERLGSALDQLAQTIYAYQTQRYEREESLATEYRGLANELKQSVDLVLCRITEAQEKLGLRSEYDTARILGRISLLSYSQDKIRLQSHATGSSLEGSAINECRARYLDLIESSLVGMLCRDAPDTLMSASSEFDEARREVGRDWPSQAKTMIGTVRMRNLRHLVERVILEGVPGDLIETGVWRGGSCIYMRAILAAYSVKDRKVWVADSFEGLPPPNEEEFPADKGDPHHTFDALRVSLDDVKGNFEQYDLLDEQVAFLKGWFKDTLNTPAIASLALLRLDGDMYESTIQALDALYPKLSPGGYVIVDDYNLITCKKAVDDYRAHHQIESPIEEVDGAAVFWRKECVTKSGPIAEET